MSTYDDEFDAFFAKEYPRVVAHLVAMGLTKDQAMDSAQEAMHRAFCYWTYLIDPPLWVRRVATREAWRTYNRDLMRRDKEIAAARQDAARPAATPEEWANTREQRRAAIDLLRSLPVAQRTVLAWKLDGYTNAEIATVTGLSAATVRSHLRHIRDRLSSSFDRGKTGEEREK